MDAGVLAATVAGTVPTIATSAATAAAAAERRRRLEEETMTSYSQKELNEDWEFKILHTAKGAFKNPERLREVLDEESRAGWVLVEKFDNSRIRLKRSPDARRNDLHLGIDPWRSYVGQTSNQREAKIVLLIVGVLLAVVGIGLAVAIAFVGPPG